MLKRLPGLTLILSLALSNSFLSVSEEISEDNKITHCGGKNKPGKPGTQKPAA